MNQIVIASSNPGKLREIARILEPLNMNAVPQSDFGVPDCPEPYVTFIENCLAKARHASAHTGLPALADDSGICVDALSGAPGVYSARYAGEPKSDARNNDKLIAALQGQTNRRAHYYCVIVLVRYADDPEPVIAEGRWFGEIIDTPRGDAVLVTTRIFCCRIWALPAPRWTPTRRTRCRIAVRRCVNWQPNSKLWADSA